MSTSHEAWLAELTALEQANNKDVVTYFLQAETGGPIKIGRSANGEAGARDRCASCQTGSPHRLVITRVMWGEYEKDLHARFALYRLAGEWFEPVKELALLASAKPGSDVDVDPGPDDLRSESLRKVFYAGYRAGYADTGALIRDCMHGLRTEETRLLRALQRTEATAWRYQAEAFKEYEAEAA